MIHPIPLSSEMLGPDPLVALARWLQEAIERSRMLDANAACLSTVSPEGDPEGRIVLLKGVDSRGLTFFTNYRSAKGRALASTPRAALTFYWDDLERQVRARGGVERLSVEESDEYFRSRPRRRQIGAWASNQSEPLESRAALEARAEALEAEFEGKEIPRPAHWGGYLLVPTEVEFWQEAPGRLHDRFVYRRQGIGRWKLERLNP